MPTVPCASPSAAADEVRITRCTPARAAARTAISAPRTLTWKSAAGSVGHIVLIPATWNTPRAARHAGGHPRLVEHVAADDLVVGERRGGGVRAGERDDVVAARGERRGERAADEAARARDEDPAQAAPSSARSAGSARTR